MRRSRPSSSSTALQLCQLAPTPGKLGRPEGRDKHRARLGVSDCRVLTNIRRPVRHTGTTGCDDPPAKGLMSASKVRRARCGRGLRTNLTTGRVAAPGVSAGAVIRSAPQPVVDAARQSGPGYPPEQVELLVGRDRGPVREPV